MKRAMVRAGGPGSAGWSAGPGPGDSPVTHNKWIFMCHTGPLFESYQICHRKPSHSSSRVTPARAPSYLVSYRQ